MPGALFLFSNGLLFFLRAHFYRAHSGYYTHNAPLLCLLCLLFIRVPLSASAAQLASGRVAQSSGSLSLSANKVLASAGVYPARIMRVLSPGERVSRDGQSRRCTRRRLMGTDTGARRRTSDE